MTNSATQPRGSRRTSIVACAQDLAVRCGYSGFTVDDLARAVGVSRRTLFNHVSSKEEAVLGALPVLTDAQATTLREGGPTGDLFDDLLTTTVDCMSLETTGIEPWQRMHDVIERNPELLVRVIAHVEELAERIVEHLTARDGVDPERAHMVFALVGGIVKRTVEECIDDPTLGPLHPRIRTNLRLARDILST